MSLAGRRERGDKLGILKTVQPHSRSRRPLEQAQRL